MKERNAERGTRANIIMKDRESEREKEREREREKERERMK